MFNRKLKRRITELESGLEVIENVAYQAVIDGYSPKGSPSERRFEYIGELASACLTPDHDGHGADD